MSDQKKILFLLNPISGIGKKGDIPHLIDIEMGATHQTEVRFTEYAGHGSEIAEEEHQNYDAIVAIGGDGTVNEVGSSLANTNCAMGIIPAGSGNGLARHLKIPLNVRSAIQRIAKFESQTIDTGTVNEEFFVGTCGFGFDGYIAELFDQHDKRGFASYAKLIAREYTAYAPKKYEIIIDSESSFHEVLFCAVANSSQFGNGFTISPNSQLSDGIMELILFQKFPLIDAPAIGTRFFTHTIHNSKYFQSIPFSDELQIKINEQETPYHLDGEPRHGSGSFSIRLHKQNLTIL